MEDKPKRKKRTRTAAQKLQHNAHERERRKRAKAEKPRFTCAKCGKVFFLPNSPVGKFDSRRTRSFVRLGGATVCEVCARARFRRKYNVWGMNPDAIPTSAF